MILVSEALDALTLQAHCRLKIGRDALISHGERHTFVGLIPFHAGALMLDYMSGLLGQLPSIFHGKREKTCYFRILA